MRKYSGRIIAYAAFGVAANSVMRGLLNSDIRPDVFWDMASKPGDQIEGIPVVKPDIESLCAHDTVLLLLKRPGTVRVVRAAINKTDIEDDIWYYYDVLDHLADYYFGKR